MMRLIVVLGFFVFGLAGSMAEAHAACASPDGPKNEGTIIYNGTHKVMQFCNGTDWIGMAGGSTSIMTGDTMFDGWPDAIVCTMGSPYLERTFYQYSPGSGVFAYVDPQAQIRLAFNNDKTFNSFSLSSSVDCNNKSIAQLYADGQAFNFVGGQGNGSGGGVSAPPTCTGPEAKLQWDGSNWLCLGSDTTPDAFSFTDQTDVAQNTLITSNSVTINGIDAPTPVSISGDGSPEFRINGGTWGTSGDIESGQSLELRLTSSASNSTMRSATVDVGGVTDQWDVTVDACAGSPTPGTVCADGSVYAGLSPGGNVAMFTTPADAPSLMSWNNGTSNWFDTAMVNCRTVTPGSQASCRTGEANTTLLVGLTGNHAPYNAAVYCDGLTAHGHSDWYLPAQDELDVLYDNRASIGNFNTSGSFPAGWYWSSSESNSLNARNQRFSDGYQFYHAKSNGIAVRCVRR